jgi:hypothetical protein
MDIKELNSIEDAGLANSEDIVGAFGQKKRKWSTPKLSRLSVAETLGGNNAGQEGYNFNRS